MPEPVSDAILLERFVNRREEAAFGALVDATDRSCSESAGGCFITSTTSRTCFRQRFSSCAKGGRDCVVRVGRGLAELGGASAARWEPGRTFRGSIGGRWRSPGFWAEVGGRI